MPSEFLFTSESVTEGHPDKVADQVSDTVLDAVLTADPAGRVACETLITTGLVVVAGEISTETYVDIPAKVRGKIAEIGSIRRRLTLGGLQHEPLVQRRHCRDDKHRNINRAGQT